MNIMSCQGGEHQFFFSDVLCIDEGETRNLKRISVSCFFKKKSIYGLRSSFVLMNTTLLVLNNGSLAVIT
jgi:hypothetical protein